MRLVSCTYTCTMFVSCACTTHKAHMCVHMYASATYYMQVTVLAQLHTSQHVKNIGAHAAAIGVLPVCTYTCTCLSSPLRHVYTHVYTCAFCLHTCACGTLVFTLHTQVHVTHRHTRVHGCMCLSVHYYIYVHIVGKGADSC